MKEYIYELDDQIYELSQMALRDKNDLLRLLSHTLKYVITEELCKSREDIQMPVPDDKKLIIHVDKMSRIFYCLKDKIFSYQFPFFVKQLDDGTVTFRFKDSLNIDSVISSMLISIFEQETILDGSIIDLYQQIDDILRTDYDVDQLDEDEFYKCILHLLKFEPGYLRYDDDDNPKRVDPIMHPRYHFDINYSTASTYKIGLKREINSDYMISLIDSDQPCVFIKQ